MGIRQLTGAVAILSYSTIAAADIPVAQIDFSFPAPQRSVYPRDVDFLRLPVTAVIVDGSSAYLPEDFTPLIAKVVGRDATVRDIVAVADAIEAKYRADGYLLVHAVVPAQQPAGGVFHITVTEESISTVVIQGVEGAVKDRLAAILAPVLVEHPLRAATVERVLLLANDLPGLKVSGLVRPAGDGGLTADLLVTVTETPFEVAVSADNASSRYAGPWLLSADVTANSPTGHGEQLSVGITVSPDAQETQALRARWLQPLGSNGLYTSTSLAVGRYEGGYTMQIYGEQARTLQIAERVGWPILRGRERNLVLEGGFTYNDNAVDMSGSNYYTDHWRVANLGLSWREAGWMASGTTTLSLGVVQGLPILGASEAGSAALSRNGRADPNATKLVAEAAGRWWLDSAWSAYVALGGQYSFSPVVEAEEFMVGGNRFGRGFDPSSLLGDHGIGETIELQYQFSAEPVIDGTLQLFAFLDHGQIWSLTGDATASSLMSTGIGIRANLFSHVSLTLQLAHPLYGPDSTVGNDPVRPYVSAIVRF